MIYITKNEIESLYYKLVEKIYGKTKFIIDVNYNYIYKLNEIIIYIFYNIYEYKIYNYIIIKYIIN